jgi:predicted TIM-barrel fold metal-dependent hydrolase
MAAIFRFGKTARKLWRLFGVYRTLLSEYPEAVQRAVLHDNALKFYRL